MGINGSKYMAKEGLTHGGDWAGYEIEYGKTPLDFSMNVNPLGIPKEVTEAIAKAGQSAERYPDPLCRELTQKLAEHEKVPPEWIFCGNGAADIIFRLAQALKPEGDGRPDRKPVLLVTAPTFSEYETAFAEYGWEIRRYVLKATAGFHIEEDFLQSIDGTVNAVFLCEPNNPTGVTTDRRLLQQIIEKCRQTGTVFIVDECFNGFLEEPAEHSMKQELVCKSEPGGLIILKAFTKLYGMAGVRLGYCISNIGCRDNADPVNQKSAERNTADNSTEASLIEKLRAAGPPWNVSSLAQAAGIAALEAKEHVAQGLRIVHEERPWLKEHLQRLGIQRIYGEANYLLFNTADNHLDALLRRRGILIRNCSNYAGLREGWYRIAVRTREENEQLITAMREVLENRGDPSGNGAPSENKGSDPTVWRSVR